MTTTTRQPRHVLATAELSEDHIYRYLLTRVWDPSLPTICWLMLNPSVADERRDDPTIRKCCGFTRRWGAGAISVVNLFAYRATDPSALAKVADAVGPDNDSWIQRTVAQTQRVVCAWGAAGTGPRARLVDSRVKQVEQLLPSSCWALGFANDRHPRHPLMLSYDTPLVLM